MNAVADRLEIIELLGRHQITIDLGDADAYAELYRPTAGTRAPSPPHGAGRTLGR
ncbi:MAG: hypothetical protein K0S78_4335 [Thermomicrobiales bacterium]|jgi:hypothetical protein|nr:hypothetical protein [Thermomicrobiales bacterium]